MRLQNQSIALTSTNFIRDQAERMGRLLRSEQEEAQRHAAIVEAIRDGLILTNDTDEIILFNSVAETILNLPRENAIGDNLLDTFAKLDIPFVGISEKAKTDSGDFITEQHTFNSETLNFVCNPVHIGDLYLGQVITFYPIT